MVIGFCGYKGAGKNEAANALVPHGYRLVAFADALKAEVTERLRLTCLEIAKLVYPSETIKTLEDNTLIYMLLTHKPPAFRRLLQEYGTQVRRADNPDYWVRQLETRITLTQFKERNFAICDLRFQNEAHMVWRFDGKVIRIKRDATWEINAADDTHESEQPDKIQADAVVVNDGSIEDLHEHVKMQVSIFEAHARKR